MDQGNKHFSHSHNLVIHQIPEGTEVSCSGCHSSATGTVYVCWQCNFFLHDQCYRATRSLKHPSHSTHPLTLVPYPTYPSNSFYCNSCQIAGTGFSYSCADCEFDLHVQCAYSISQATTRASASIPLGYPQNPIPSAQDPSTPQNRPVAIPTSSHDSSAQYPSLAQTGLFVIVHTNPQDAITGSHDPSIPQNGPKEKEIMHFSHPHKLSKLNLQEDGENEVLCSGCEETLVGNGYSCIKPDCNFHLHESCFNLKKEIYHNSHPEHPLTLLPLAPYKNEDGGFTCNACFIDGTAFTYHCSICTFDLHVTCVSLPETVKRDDHKHTLKLHYSCPVKDEDFGCDVCHGEVQKDGWGYYCEQCDYTTHLGCVDREEDSIQEQLQRIQLKMQMVRVAQQSANWGSNLGSLIG